jgi:hypothetical protein
LKLTGWALVGTVTGRLWLKDGLPVRPTTAGTEATINAAADTVAASTVRFTVGS